jgi:hypothetical protein
MLSDHKTAEHNAAWLNSQKSLYCLNRWRHSLSGLFSYNCQITVFNAFRFNPNVLLLFGH